MEGTSLSLPCLPVTTARCMGLEMGMGMILQTITDTDKDTDPETDQGISKRRVYIMSVLDRINLYQVVHHV